MICYFYLIKIKYISRGKYGHIVNRELKKDNHIIFGQCNFIMWTLKSTHIKEEILNI